MHFEFNAKEFAEIQAKHDKSKSDRIRQNCQNKMAAIVSRDKREWEDMQLFIKHVK